MFKWEWRADVCSSDLTGVAAGNSGGVDVSGQVGTTIAGTYGFLSVDTAGHYTYTLTKPFDTTPDANNGPNTETGKDVFSFTVTDGLGNTSTSTISINIKDDVPHNFIPALPTLVDPSTHPSPTTPSSTTTAPF